MYVMLRYRPNLKFLRSLITILLGNIEIAKYKTQKATSDDRK